MVETGHWPAERCVREGVLADLAIEIAAAAGKVVQKHGGEPVDVAMQLSVVGGRTQISVDLRGSGLIALNKVEQSRRDGRLVAIEILGCSLGVLQRLDHVWYDDDLRETLVQVRDALAVAQSKIKERLVR